jgi:hypothetical protein
LVERANFQTDLTDGVADDLVEDYNTDAKMMVLLQVDGADRKEMVDNAAALLVTTKIAEDKTGASLIRKAGRAKVTALIGGALEHALRHM